MILFSIFVATGFAVLCEKTNNIPSGPFGTTWSLNEHCTWAGECMGGPPNVAQMPPQVQFSVCSCCTIDSCPGMDFGHYEGTTSTNAINGCADLNLYVSIKMDYHVVARDGSPTNTVVCSGDDASIPILGHLRTFFKTNGYDGYIQSLGCRACTSSNTCEFTENNEKKTFTTGIQVKLATDYNTHYALTCARPNNAIPTTWSIDGCPENKDAGYFSSYVLDQARLNANGDDIADMQYLNNVAYDSSVDYVARFQDTKHVSIQGGSTRTRAPTADPTPMPTTPEPTEDSEDCTPYINLPSDLKFIGIGSSCRAGISDDWPGGKTCASPYLVCLPGSNTPNQDPKKKAITSTTHRYSLEECRYECTWDQRCLGFEFVADPKSSKGDCTLVDDIPVEIEGEISGSSFVYVDDDAHDGENLDSDRTGGTALCFAKLDYCNPYFPASQLNDVMLNCYCPNNRKGFYTKKVKRIVNNTKYCQSDAAVTERIKLAQANRMFHLCENWCLFNTENPELESWYWDPWVKCWREQYAGTGMHRSYCNRVIRNPYTIEQQFLNARAASFCADNELRLKKRTPSPTAAWQSPSGSLGWYMIAEEQSCEDFCSNDLSFSMCDIVSIMQVTSGADMPSDICDGTNCSKKMSCTSMASATEGWAAPAQNVKTGACLWRDVKTSIDLDTGCQWTVGDGYRQICACRTSGP